SLERCAGPEFVVQVEEQPIFFVTPQQLPCSGKEHRCKKSVSSSGTVPSKRQKSTQRSTLPACERLLSLGRRWNHVNPGRGILLGGTACCWFRAQVPRQHPKKLRAIFRRQRHTPRLF